MKFIIKGGRQLNGAIEVYGSKNAATPILAATILNEKPCIIDNLPLIEDVFRMLDILKGLGAEIVWLDERRLKISTKNINPLRIDLDIISRLRSSILFIGALLTRFGIAKTIEPGGCLIGKRPIDTHLEAFRSLGVKVNYESKTGLYEFRKTKSINNLVVLREFSVTATENILIFASLLPQKTIIKIAAVEPHVLDLCCFLRKLGVKIQNPEPHVFEVTGLKKINREVEHKIIYDPIEAGTFLVLGAINKGGKIEVKNIQINHLDLVLAKLLDFGVKYNIIRHSKNLSDIIVFGGNKLKASTIQTLPYPGFPTDLQTVFGLLATQAEGNSLIYDTLYENRFRYLIGLRKMGAKFKKYDDHRVLILGPTKLKGRKIKSFDLRGGATLVLAGLIAEGTTHIYNAYQVDRGYERIEERLQKLGADIVRKV